MSASLKHALHALLVALCSNRGLAQVALPLRRLLRQDVAVKRLVTLDLAFARQLEALRHALARLHLRHTVPLHSIGNARGYCCVSVHPQRNDYADFFGATTIV